MIAMAGFMAISASAQYAPSSLNFKKGKLADNNGKVLSEEQVIAAIGQNIYEETYVGARKQIKTGKTLVKVGIPVAVAGIVITGIGSSKLDGTSISDALADTATDEQKQAALISIGGSLISSIGGVCIDAGIPLWVIGKKRLKWIAEDYNAKNVSYVPSVKVGTAAHGYGLTVTF